MPAREPSCRSCCSTCSSPLRTAAGRASRTGEWSHRPRHPAPGAQPETKDETDVSNEPSPTDLDHPRPQLVRERWQDLCGEWDFAFDDDDLGLGERWMQGGGGFDRTITVPYPPESSCRGSIGTPSARRSVWYRRICARSNAPADEERLLLHFGAVDYRPTVWVNGHLVGTTRAGTRRSPSTSRDASTEGDQVVVVRAEDHPTTSTQPRGKQDWLRGAARHLVPPHHRHLAAGVAGVRAAAPSTTSTGRPTSSDRSAWRSTPAATAGRGRSTPGPPERRGALARATRQRVGPSVAPDRGARHPAQATARTSADYCGPRPTPTSSTRPSTLLDGRAPPSTRCDPTSASAVSGSRTGASSSTTSPCFLRSCSSRATGRSRTSPHRAPTRCVARSSCIKELGFNGVRIHQKVEDPRFLYWCDRLGLLVWGEMPSAYEFSPTSRRAR